MSVSYFVRYDIETADVEAFMRRYRDVHTPLAWRDPFPVNAGKAVLMAQLEDLKQFPRYEGTVVHQAMAQHEVYRAPWLDANEEGAW